MPQKAKLLCIDDNPLNLKLMIDLFRHDYDIKVVNSALKGVELLKTYTPDIILLDVMMPDMDGYEFCQLVRKMPQFALTPIIFITAKSNPEDEKQAYASGGNDFITKPIIPISLQAKVAMHLKLAAEARPASTSKS
ncbi:hypothetical protein THIAE_00120 [Thiomicrospira aerophila AL3]|uniref:Response regulatory domain-containing protein n=1 Tax=Thiomicrospira aerophila AL3 TaxID=717772 RepID=W0DUD3_9GAMM|nr:response regulator [Thiomicrospira aerophila]AHF02165.1 hypothetical protein THIAE_00120 [Thiomicrospira aerophila AL3]